MKLKNAFPKPYSMKMKMDSDTFFNHPSKAKDYEAMGFDVDPVDVYGGFVPTGKDISNLKKTEKYIRERFDLNPDGGEQ